MSYKDVLANNQHSQHVRTANNQNSRNTTIYTHKPTAASTAVQVSTNKKWGSADVRVIRSPGKPAEDGFNTMI
jgi:hypothetical protein